MSTERFDLIFSGQLVRGFDPNQAKRNVQNLFRLNEAKTDMLFSGKAIPLKKGLDLETATKYRVAMKKAGVLVSLVEAPEAAAKIGDATKQNAEPESVSSDTTLSTTLGAQPEREVQDPVVLDAPDFGVADMEGYLVAEDEIGRQEPVDIDVGALSVKETEGFLVETEELEHIDMAEIPVPDFELAPAGSDVLKEDERTQHESVDVNTDTLSLAEAGERLGPESKPAPAAPKVDHISLAD